MISFNLAAVALALTACTPMSTGDTANPGDAGTVPDSDAATDTGSGTDADTTAWGSRMVRIPAGTFTMAGASGDPDDDYQEYEVTLTRAFWMGATEVTRRQWESFGVNWEYDSLADYPCTTATSASDCPADSLSWYDAAKYANALSAREGRASCYLADGTDLAAAFLGDPYSCPGYRLPTEAEWEYAARAGEDTMYAGSNTSTDVGWTAENAYDVGTYAHESGTLASNAWGLYDMSGNVWEWTNDWERSGYEGYGDGSAQTNPAGPSSSSFRAARGGGWSDSADEATVSHRFGLKPDYTRVVVGFRLARATP